jgi:hypothetical protein
VEAGWAMLARIAMRRCGTEGINGSNVNRPCVDTFQNCYQLGMHLGVVADIRFAQSYSRELPQDEVRAISQQHALDRYSLAGIPRSVSVDKFVSAI